MAEEQILEVWAIVQGRRQRVYRGRSQEHVSWKLEEYSRHMPEVVEIQVPGEAGEKKN